MKVIIYFCTGLSNLCGTKKRLMTHFRGKALQIPGGTMSSSSTDLRLRTAGTLSLHLHGLKRQDSVAVEPYISPDMGHVRKTALRTLGNDRTATNGVMILTLQLTFRPRGAWPDPR